VEGIKRVWVWDMGNTNVDLWKVKSEYGSGTWVILMWICGRYKRVWVWDVGKSNVDLWKV